MALKPDSRPDENSEIVVTGGFRPVEFPVFTMPRAWVADHLSDAAVALLARAAARGVGGVDVPEAIADELRAAGLIVDGALVDPGTLAWQAHAAAYVPPAPAPDPSVVYYLRRADGAVKIGHSADLAARIARLTEVYGTLELLATERGGWHLETRRHGEFERWRLPRDPRLEGGSEWFTVGAPLRRHLRALAVAA